MDKGFHGGNGAATGSISPRPSDGNGRQGPPAALGRKAKRAHANGTRSKAASETPIGTIEIGRGIERPTKLTRQPARHSPNDVKPQTPVATFKLNGEAPHETVPIERVAPLVGMAPTFIRKVVGSKAPLTPASIALLVNQDSFVETFIPRSKILHYLFSAQPTDTASRPLPASAYSLLRGNALELISRLPSRTVQCVVTSTPYWAMRLYQEMAAVKWADGEECIFGLEQTPEGFVRHSVEVITALARVLTDDGSIWWNIMDTFNTRTQIRGNAAEALRAMQGKETRSWKQYNCRRYSAGHSYLKDGEQCLIPFKIAERVSRAGLYVKSVICWAKTSTLPEPQDSRVSRNVEYILHISKCRAPLFQKESYRSTPAPLGGRNTELEADKLSDYWVLPTSSGRDGHGAQFPIALPGRCIALSSNKGGLVLDPFVGAGTSGEAALRLGRRFIGIDTSESYLATARRRLTVISKQQHVTA
jgi:DNA modification methylase